MHFLKIQCIPLVQGANPCDNKNTWQMLPTPRFISWKRGYRGGGFLLIDEYRHALDVLQLAIKRLCQRL